MHNVNKFQVIVLTLFAFFIVAGLGVFSLYKGQTTNVLPVTIWGTINRGSMGVFIDKISQDTETDILYIQKSPATFEQEILEALATGTGPDAIILPQDSILTFQNKIIQIPYSSYPEVQFKNTFIQEGELYLSDQGLYAVPFAIDPLVMYWNRDIFTNANLPLPPKSWEEFLALSPKLTRKDAAFNITQSAFALGEYRNITNAKDIISLLLMQVGDSITTRTPGGISSTLGANLGSSAINPADRAINFYTQFADPAKSIYSWNRSLAESKELFLANRLAIYFGYASELAEIRAKNPNLNFDVAMVPQSQSHVEQGIKATFGKMYGIAILRSSKDPANTLSAISLLTSKEVLAEWGRISGLPSVRRDSLNFDPGNAAAAIFASSALNAQAWIDPHPRLTSDIFQQMIEDITSGRSLTIDALNVARQRIDTILHP